MPLPPLVLASRSPRRRDLLREAGFDFDVVPSTAEEIHDPALAPADLTERNAALKAEAVAKAHPGAVVIGADTLVFIDGEPIGKPRDFADAVRMIRQLNGRTHEVCTGVCLCRWEPRKAVCFHAITAVTFRELSLLEIEDYLVKINPLDKAGAYAAQEHGSLIIEKTAGSWTNIVGLPMETFPIELDRFLREPGPGPVPMPAHAD